MDRAVGKDSVERTRTHLSQREKRQIRLLQLQRVRRSLFRIRLMSPMWLDRKRSITFMTFSLSTNRNNLQKTIAMTADLRYDYSIARSAVDCIKSEVDKHEKEGNK